MSKAAEVYVGGGWYKKGKNFSPYDLERAAASYAAELPEALSRCLSMEGSTAAGAVSACFACGGLRADVYGTEGRGVVLVSYGYETAAARVPVSVWEYAWRNCFPLGIS